MYQRLHLLENDSTPLSVAEIEHLESILGRLPDEYREFLHQCNGGRPERHELVVRMPGDSTQVLHFISRFNTLSRDESPEQLLVPVDNVLTRMLVIAECDLSPIMIALEGSRKGEVFYWHYSQEDFEVSEESQIAKVTNGRDVLWINRSFSELIEQIEIIPEDDFPSIKSHNPSIQQLLREGDNDLEVTKSVLSRLSVEQLNRGWENEGGFTFSAINYAAKWAQIKTVEYLMERGVDTNAALHECLGNFEITKLLLTNCTTEIEGQKLLQSAASYLSCTSAISEVESTIKYLVERGIRPNFNDPEVLSEWRDIIAKTHNRKFRKFLINTIKIPDQ